MGASGDWDSLVTAFEGQHARRAHALKLTFAIVRPMALNGLSIVRGATGSCAIAVDACADGCGYLSIPSPE